MTLQGLRTYLDDLLEIASFPDYPNAMNGLQVEGRAEIGAICGAVDASETAISTAIDRNADLLLVHHGLLWEGSQPVTGRHFRKLRALLSEGMGLYSAHLPLDAHPEFGNCAVLARKLGIEIKGRFGEYGGREIGWWGHLSADREDLHQRITEKLGGPVRLMGGGPERVERVAVITGGGASFIPAAAEAGLEALITGEGGHHSYFDAMELGINVYYAGHYATETWGVKAIGSHVEAQFKVPFEFIDLPTGL